MAQEQHRQTPPGKKSAPPKKDRATEIANTFEWLITAFILAFVFRAFVMEAFRIPTGSMADTLHGAHFRLRCPECGYKYDRGFVPESFSLEQDSVPSRPVALPAVKCPSCGFLEQQSRFNQLRASVDNGDRILVLKCLYQIANPKRWDVIVFKNPMNPRENYIKRLIGLPGEKIEIVDGDIYINNTIARKPPMVQKEQWMPIYDNDYQPVNPDNPFFNGETWQNPFAVHETAWVIRKEDPTRFHLSSPPDQVDAMVYGAPSANDFRVFYAYNDIRMAYHAPNCSDLMIRFYAQAEQGRGIVGAGLGKYGVMYKGLIDLQGRMVITRETGQDQAPVELARLPIDIAHPTEPQYVQFANVDHLLILKYGAHVLTYDLGTSEQSLERHEDYPPQVALLGAGQLSLSHVALFRDIYYMSAPSSGRTPRANEEDPFQLHQDEFFVLGDNSPNSKDGRWWGTPTMATKGQTPPRAGVVPRRYLVGKAMFVYWPSGFQFPWPQTVLSMVSRPGRQNGLLRLANALVTLKWIPDVGEMRFIYGGSEDNPNPVVNPVSGPVNPSG